MPRASRTSRPATPLTLTKIFEEDGVGFGEGKGKRSRESFPFPLPNASHHSPTFTTLAGTPATTAFGGTSRTTTDPAATMAPSPMVTPLRIREFMPIPDVRADGYAAIQLKGGLDVPRLGGPVRVEIGIRDHAVRAHHRILADGNGARARRDRRAAELDAFRQIDAGRGRTRCGDGRARTAWRPWRAAKRKSGCTPRRGGYGCRATAQGSPNRTP